MNLKSGSKAPHIFADPDPGRHNVADPTDPNPDYCFPSFPFACSSSFLFPSPNYFSPSPITHPSFPMPSPPLIRLSLFPNQPFSFSSPHTPRSFSLKVVNFANLQTLYAKSFALISIPYFAILAQGYLSKEGRGMGGGEFQSFLCDEFFGFLFCILYYSICVCFFCL